VSLEDVEARDEERRIRALRRLTDMVCDVLRQSPLSLAEALGLLRELRALAARMFPDRVHVFDLVLRPRLRRIIRERFRERFVVEGEGGT
jgi:hypothetical protein